MRHALRPICDALPPELSVERGGRCLALLGGGRIVRTQLQDGRLPFSATHPHTPPPSSCTAGGFRLNSSGAAGDEEKNKEENSTFSLGKTKVFLVTHLPLD